MNCPRAAVTLVLLAVAGVGGCAAGGTQPIPEPSGPIVATPEAPPAVPGANAGATTTPDTATVTPAAPTDPRNYVTIRIKVSGMTCPIRCVREVKEQLAAVPGVLHVDIDSDRREAVVDIAPGTDPETVVAGLHGDYRGRLL